MRKSVIKSNHEASSSIYLIPRGEGLWSASINTMQPSRSAIRLCDEQEYPVTVFYCRYDLNGSSVYEEDICHNAEDLISTLNWCGKCGHTVLKVWDFSLENAKETAIGKLFHDGYLKKTEQLAEEMSGATSAVYADPTLPDQAMNLLTGILNQKNGDELFQLAEIIFSLRGVASENDILLLARKTHEACLFSTAPLSLAARVDAVHQLLEHGLDGKLFPDFPEVPAETLSDILVSCETDVFMEIVDTAALSLHASFAPDISSIMAVEAKKSALNYINKAITQKKPPLDNQISTAGQRIPNTSNPRSFYKDHDI